MPLHIAVLVFLLTAFTPSAVRAQDDLTQGKVQPDAFFSGNVVEVAADQVAVSRTILGKPPEKRTFKITPATKIEGKMNQKSRVTVRYTPGEDGDIALSIIVRADKNDNDKKK